MEERSISSLLFEVFLGIQAVQDRTKRLSEAGGALTKDIDKLEETAAARRATYMVEVWRNELASVAMEASKLATSAGQLLEQLKKSQK